MASALVPYEIVTTAKDLREEDHIILLLGAPGSGRTSFLDNLIFGRPRDDSGLEIKNLHITAYRVKISFHKKIGLADFVIIETPGWDKDMDVPNSIIDWLKKGHADRPIHIAAFIYFLHRANNRPLEALKDHLKKIINKMYISRLASVEGVNFALQETITVVDPLVHRGAQSQKDLQDTLKEFEDVKTILEKTPKSDNPGEFVVREVFTRQADKDAEAGTTTLTVAKYGNTGDQAWGLISKALHHYSTVEERTSRRVREIDALPSRGRRSPKTLEEFIKGSYTVHLNSETESDDVMFIMLGLTGSGKSSFITTAIGKDIGIVGDTLKSHTKEVNAVRLVPADPTFPSISFVDTPGFDDTDVPDGVVLQILADWLLARYKKSIPIAGVLYCQRITDSRLSSTGAKILDLFYKVCGKKMMDRAVFVTTMWDEESSEGIKLLAEHEERYEEWQRDHWKPCIQKGAKASKYSPRWRQSAFKIIQPLIEAKNSITLDSDDFRISKGSVRVQREMAVDQLTLRQTGAGQAVFGVLTSQIQEVMAEITTLESEINAGGPDVIEKRKDLALRRDKLAKMKADHGQFKMGRMEKAVTKTRQFMKGHL